MFVQDQILHFLRATGPTLPAKVAKNIKTEILIASAHLSDLASQGKIKISSLKIGGSPLYYLPGQESQLYNFAAGNLNPKDVQVLERLKEQKVLREKDLDLLAKVALRSLKDFAIPLQVRSQQTSELFWKWHLLSEEETNNIIGDILSPPAPPKEKASEMSETGDVVSPPAAEISLPEVQTTLRDQQATSIEENKSRKRTRRSAETRPIKKQSLPQDVLHAEQGEKEEEQQKNQKEKQEKGQEQKQEEKPVLAKLRNKTLDKKKETAPDPFLLRIQQFFQERQITVEQSEIIRKNKELDLCVQVPSVVGEITYFCKAKNKKRCDEKDLSAAYMEAQIKKLPLLFLYSDQLTPKVQEMLETDVFLNTLIKKIE